MELLMRSVLSWSVVFALMTVSPASAATMQVPAEFPTIQAAIDAAQRGDTVVVSAGTYHERIRLKAGIVVRSAGDDARGRLGLRRAETTIIDGAFEKASGPGVTMAEDSTLDGFTVTGVGKYDEKLWNKHHATQGEEQSHEPIGAPGTAGIAVIGISTCHVTHNIVHHIGYTGIAIMGQDGKRVAPGVVQNICYRNMGGGIGSMQRSTAIIESNICFENFYAGIGHDDASPLVLNNTCYDNVRAGIGVSEGSCPIVRGNRCYRNRRAGIGIRSGAATQPVVENNDCYENHMAGIGNRDSAQPIIRDNRCYKNRMAGIGSRDGARPVIEGNACYENRMAGIGSRLEAAGVIRGNRCYRNLMAGIGSREGARPVIEDNECFENRMAGIGTQQDAAPVIRNNRCYGNVMAGIGSRLGARPVISDNACFENQMAGISSREGAAAVIRGNRSYKNQMAGFGNRRGARSILVDNVSAQNQMAGIGVRDQPTNVVIVGNRCVENRLVAIGLPDGASGFIHGNQLVRTEGGAPPLLAVKGGSVGIVSHNSIRGGGVAGVLVQGDVQVVGNRFHGKGPGQGSAVWVWKNSAVSVVNNHVNGYRNAVNSSGSRVSAIGNVVRGFQGPSIIVRKPTAVPQVHNNIAISADGTDGAVIVDGVPGEPAARPADDNRRKRSEKSDRTQFPEPAVWPLPAENVDGNSFHPLARSDRSLSVREGPWKLVVTYGKQTTYALFHIEDDPQQKTDLSSRLEQITFYMRGLFEQKEALEFQREMRPGKPG